MRYYCTHCLLCVRFSSSSHYVHVHMYIHVVHVPTMLYVHVHVSSSNLFAFDIWQHTTWYMHVCCMCV